MRRRRTTTVLVSGLLAILIAAWYWPRKSASITANATRARKWAELKSRSAPSSGQPAQPRFTAPSPMMLAGFRQEASNSRFALGTYRETRDEYGLIRVVGSEGVFATRKSNGFVMAIPNGDAGSVKRPPLTNDGDKHNARVLKYFLEAGLPSEQVGGLNASATMAADGTSVGGDLGPDRLLSYTSDINRSVDGISLPDSNAWAQFNDRDEVVSEGSYWPAIPQSVVDEAKALQAFMADPALAEEYRAKLPTSNRDGRVVIRHSSPTEDEPPRYFVSFDVVERVAPGAVVTRHFDRDAQEFTLPGERTEVASESSAVKR
jgi:hypothetical protein